MLFQIKICNFNFASITVISGMPHDATIPVVEQLTSQAFKENTPPSGNSSNMGEINYETVYLSSKVDEKLHVVNSIIRMRKRKIAMLQLKNHLLQKKIALLTEIIASLKEKDCVRFRGIKGRSI